MSDSPFTLLVEIVERAEGARTELPAASTTRTHWTGLGFSLLGQRFVVPMDEVAEMIRIPQITRLPGVKPFVNGVGNVRGRLMAVLDMATFFGEASTLPRTQRRVLAVEQEEQFFGFIVDESLGMQHFPSESFRDEASEMLPVFKPFIRGSFSVAGTEWPVMSIPLLLDHPELEKFALAS